MPIEFACTQCGKQLRTPDETAGRQAKCPQCGAIMQIPHFASAAPLPPFGDAAEPDSQGWNPYASPNVGGQSATPASVAAAGITPTRAELSRVFSTTWSIFNRRIGLCMALGIVAIIVSFVMAIVAGVIQTAMGGGIAAGMGPQGMRGRLGAIILSTVVTQLLMWAVSTWLLMGIVRAFLCVARGEPASVGDVLSGGPYCVRGMLINLIFLISGIVGYVLAAAAMIAANGNIGAFLAVLLVLFVVQFIVYLSVSQSHQLIVDRDLGAIDAIRTSSSIMSGNKLTLFLMMLVLIIAGVGLLVVLSIASGILAFALGETIAVVLVSCAMLLIALGTMPYIWLLLAVFYLHVTGQPTMDPRDAAM
ncbi:MAG: hypothetical protein WD875_10295 [Pirellulales bacterium]